MKSIKRAFKILDTVRIMEGTGASNLSQELDIPRSTAHDYLKVLNELGLLINNDGRYEVSLKFLDYGGDVRKDMDIYPCGWPEVQNLALETGEHANLMIEEFGKGRYIYIAEGKDSAKLDTYTGMEVELHTTALGKAILAHLPKKDAEAIIDSQELPSITSNTITDRDDLFKELRTIRQRGYATDQEERAIGVQCIASPIQGQNGEIFGSIGVSGPASRFSGEQFEDELSSAVQRSANLIELNIANM
ncbi:IclR family transcriptional regulator [Halorubrum trueperi]|uniref:IclR family transcriptional regulator n=2 Tax=Halorubrum trueperi TaxID=2004704 RepID=A0ABD5ULX9_9EURY